MLCVAVVHADPAVPPGFNVHVVREKDGKVMWRGGAPRRDTLQALQARHVPVTLIDLRHPAHADDASGRDGRLSPESESILAKEMGFHYESIGALDKALLDRIAAALQRGDVYIHCMYGVNRTGFAVARYATALGLEVSRDGLGTRDWQDGARFQQQIAPSQK